MINPDNTFIALFSYNKTLELEIALSSIKKHMPDFTVHIYDDHSNNPQTLEILERYCNNDKLHLAINSVEEDRSLKSVEKCGNLHRNMQKAYCDALQQGAEYLFLIQDDIQILRSFSTAIRKEYFDLFEKNDLIIQVDPRFVRKDCNAHYSHELGGYAFPQNDHRRGYADVGLFKINRLKEANWVFLDGERPNKFKALELGVIRVFPFTSLMMHVPFPSLYRKGKKLFKDSLISGRGQFSYCDLTEHDCIRLDTRSPEDTPYPRKYLKIKGHGLLKYIYKIHIERMVYGGSTFFHGIINLSKRLLKNFTCGKSSGTNFE